MKPYLTTNELSEILGVCAPTLNTIFSRAEFRKHEYHAQRFKYVITERFKQDLHKSLEQKMYKKFQYSKKLIEHTENGLKVLDKFITSTK